MDRNTIVGLVLIAGIFLTFQVFFGPEKQEKKEGDQTKTEQVDSTAKVKRDSTAMAKQTRPFDPKDTTSFIPVGMSDSAFAAMSDSAKAALIDNEKLSRFGHFAPLHEGEDKVITVETDKFSVDLHSLGGTVRNMILKEYKTWDSLPLPLITDDAANSWSLKFEHNYRTEKFDNFFETHTRDLYLEPSTNEASVKVSGDEEKKVSFKGAIDDRHFFEFIYTFKGNAYDYDLEVKMSGMADIVNNSSYDIFWNTIIPKTEMAMDGQRQKTAIYYRESGDVEWVNPRGSGVQNEKKNSVNIDWIAFKSQFFSQTMMAASESEPFENLVMAQRLPVPPDPEDPNSGDIVRLMHAEVQINFGMEKVSSKHYTFFNGPLDYDVLNGYERGMKRQIELGWGPLKWVNQVLVIPLFNLLQGMNLNYGIIILLLAIIVKLLLYPLTYRTYISTAKMRVINNTPEIKALEEKYKDNATKLQQEKMLIYRQNGVNMLGGCWPMLLQYPFLIALFYFFPNSIELRQESFLWAQDLSTYDSVLDLGFYIPMYGDHVSLFTLLMTISIFAFTVINQQMQATTVNNPVMKWFPYIMPLIFLGFLNNYSSGLSWYYLVSNLISITQTTLTKRYIDEDKLLEQMRAKAKQKKKKGKGGKSRLERWADQQQRRQKDMQQQRQKMRNMGAKKKRK